jgi:hypothetical protein
VVFGFFSWTGGDLAVDADLLKKSCFAFWCREDIQRVVARKVEPEMVRQG